MSFTSERAIFGYGTTIVALAFLCIMAVMMTLSKSDPVVKVMTIPKSTFKAAVYAHVVYIPVDPFVVSRAKAVENMEINLNVYRAQAENARQQNVNIVVFPEDGIYGMSFSRDTIYPYLEQIPDPQTETWNPCTDPQRHNDADVQVALSCMARKNHLYLVANMGDKVPCNPKFDPKCPEDGRYQFNTDVAYGPDGLFLAKYHKYNLFFEYQFDTPVNPSHSYFDTPFGRVGMATCFDVLFSEPIIPLVEDFNVSVIAFPTAWMDALPLLPAIGFHSSFARAHGVNFLAANIHLPLFKFDGSGLYAPDGARAFYYTKGTSALTPKLLIASMDVLSYRPNQIVEHMTDRSAQRNGMHGMMKTLRSINNNHFTNSSTTFESELFYDTYTFQLLNGLSQKLRVCQGKICCYLDYELQAPKYSDNGDQELFAFGAFDGLHTYDGDYYMQNCILVKCADAKNKKSCGSLTFTSSTRFTKISMRGQFQTKYVYPQVVVSDDQGQLALTKPEAWTFNGTVLDTSNSFSANVLNAVLLGRDYSRDH